eukprot:COSAG06_NODE_37764_length_431_cov_1.075301_1_plen_36_part_10
MCRPDRGHKAGLMPSIYHAELKTCRTFYLFVSDLSD